MLRFFGSILGAIFSLITLTLLMGAFVVGALFYIYGKKLPNHEALAQYKPPTISRIYDGDGRLIDEFAKERRVFVPIEDVPDVVKYAFVSAEDKNFYRHKGYDGVAMAYVLYEAIASRGETLRGASTITQQVTKNLLLGGERKLERKIAEIILASRMEQTLSKDRILELYLNEIFLGQNSSGVVAAAQVYFNKSLSELAPHEAATLAAMPKAPSDYHPVRDRERLLNRRNYVLREMWQNGYLDEATFKTEREMPLKSVQNGDYPSFRSHLPPRDYFTDEIRRQLSGSFGEDEFFAGGLTVRATVEADLQRAAAQALRNGLEKYDRGQGIWRGTRLKIDAALLGDEAAWREALAKSAVPRDIEGWHPAVVLSLLAKQAVIGVEGVTDGNQVIEAKDVTWAHKRLAGGRAGARAKVPADLLEPGDIVLVRAAEGQGRWSLRQVPEVQGAFMAMDVFSGRVLAMQGGFSYQSSVFNRATQATRQPGSSFKPFVYASALDTGFTPATIVVDAPIELSTAQGIWRPKNASNKFYGPAPLRTGIEQSRNLMTVRIAQEITMETVAKYAERFGIYDHLQPFLSNSLGAQETTLYKMVAAYAMLANGGERVVPTLVDRVQDRYGKSAYRHDPRQCVNCGEVMLPDGAGPRITSQRERVIDPITAYQITSMMEGVVQRGTGRSVKLPVPVAGKTGTTNDAKDVWFIGYTSQIAAGCYIGYDNPRTLGDRATGGGLCAPVFQEFMLTAVKKYGGGPFAVPPGGYFVKIDRFSGARLSDDAAGPNVVAEYFRPGEERVFASDRLVDGGFSMGSNLPLFSPGESEGGGGVALTNSSGRRVVVPDKPNLGTVSSGGLY